MLTLILFGEFLLHIPCWLHWYAGSFSYTFRAGFTIVWGVSVTHPMLALILSGVSLTQPVLASILSAEFLLDIPCWIHLYAGSLPYTFRACVTILFHLGSFSYTSYASFNFIWAVSLTHPMLAWFFFGEFILHITYRHNCVGSLSYRSRSGFNFIWGVSLTHPVLASILSGQFLLHIPCLLDFSLGSSSYTSHTATIVWGVSLTHPVLALILSGEFLLHLLC